jgi:hypothetical protein
MNPFHHLTRFLLMILILMQHIKKQNAMITDLQHQLQVLQDSDRETLAKAREEKIAEQKVVALFSHHHYAVELHRLMHFSDGKTS